MTGKTLNKAFLALDPTKREQQAAAHQLVDRLIRGVA